MKISIKAKLVIKKVNITITNYIRVRIVNIIDIVEYKNNMTNTNKKKFNTIFIHDMKMSVFKEVV